MTLRKLKERLRPLLAVDLQKALTVLAAWPERQAINPLFGLLYDRVPLVRWRAVVAMGHVTARLAAHDLEGGRVIMRRLMWNLNEESGGFGWGSPEAMGAIMARDGRLAREYSAILVSYLDPECNFLEHPTLQEGVLWALGHLARVDHLVVAAARPAVYPFLAADTAALRGMALWTAAAYRQAPPVDLLTGLEQDAGALTIFEDDRLQPYTVAQLARALQQTGGGSGGKQP